jgi:hypothetical protein
LVQFLLRTVPGLVKAGSANSIEALDAALRRALDDFENVGLEGMRDLRSEKSGNRHPELCPDCWHKALALDVKSGGNECLAWRLLKTKNQLCPECAARHHFDSSQHPTGAHTLGGGRQALVDKRSRRASCRPAPAPRLVE